MTGKPAQGFGKPVRVEDGIRLPRPEGLVKPPPPPAPPPPPKAP